MTAGSKLKILSSHAALEALNACGRRFEERLKCRLNIECDPTHAMRRRIEEGESFDVALIARSALDALADGGFVDRSSCVDIARCGLGVSVRHGAPKPDVSSVEAFRRTLLAAPRIVRSTDGVSGHYFVQMTERLGIAAELQDRVILGPSGRVAEFVARGEADLAVQQISELLPVRGVDYVGPFPPELQLYTVFSAAVTNRNSSSNARALVSFLADRAQQGDFIAAGFEPIGDADQRKTSV